jgi:alkylation response protein AidB-like acyl-CoA dehydrogenase
VNVFGGALWLVVAALQFVEENTQDRVERARIESMPAARKVLGLAQELAAKREAIELLLIREQARRDGVEFGERATAALFPSLLMAKVRAAEFSLAVADAGVRGGDGMLREEGLEKFFEQSFKP